LRVCVAAHPGAKDDVEDGTSGLVAALLGLLDVSVSFW